MEPIGDGGVTNPTQLINRTPEKAKMATTRSSSRKKNGNHFETRISALKEDFDSLQHNVRELLDAVGHDASDGISSAAGAASETIMSAAGQVETWGEAGTESVRGAIRTQPLAAIALSMGAGALIGAYLRR